MRLNNTTDRGEWRTHSSIYNGALITITAKMSTLEVWLGSECDSAQAFCRKPATLRALRALRALRLTCSRVSRASCLTWSHTSSVSCLTCSRALRDLLPHMPHMCLVLYFSRVSSASCLMCLVLYVFLCLTCLSCLVLCVFHMAISPHIFSYCFRILNVTFFIYFQLASFWGEFTTVKIKIICR